MVRPRASAPGAPCTCDSDAGERPGYESLRLWCIYRWWWQAGEDSAGAGNRRAEGERGWARTAGADAHAERYSREWGLVLRSGAGRG